MALEYERLRLFAVYQLPPPIGKLQPPSLNIELRFLKPRRSHCRKTVLLVDVVGAWQAKTGFSNASNNGAGPKAKQ
jgi:hypothetical protein